MSYELSHDTIARQVFEKSTLEARTRRKVEKYIRERLEAQQQRDVQLTNDDLDYISPYLSVINLTAEESQFLEEGKKKLAAARRKKRMGVMGVIVGLVGLSLVSYFFMLAAEKARGNAILVKQETIESIFTFVKETKPLFAEKLITAESLKGHWDRLGNYGLRLLELKPHQDQETGLWGYVDSRDSVFIDYRYESADSFGNGWEANVTLNQEDYIINIFGETTKIIKTIFEWKPSTTGQTLPPGSIVGGSEFQDSSGRERTDLYVGRASYALDRYGGKHPGKIKNRAFFISYGGKAEPINTFEVLVLGNEGQAAWVEPTQVEDYEDLGWEKLLGGYNDIAQTKPLFVTRARYEGQLIPGKLFLEKCHFPYQGQERLTPDFEYLMVAKKTVRNPDKTTAASTK